jgi:hypothetical protein
MDVAIPDDDPVAAVDAVEVTAAVDDDAEAELRVSGLIVLAYNPTEPSPPPPPFRSRR